MAEGKFSTFVHLMKFIETLAVNYDWTEAFMMYIAFLLGFIYSEIISTESFWQWHYLPNDNLKDEKTYQTKKFNG